MNNQNFSLQELKTYMDSLGSILREMKSENDKNITNLSNFIGLLMEGSMREKLKPCSFCSEESVDSVTLEAGNDVEVQVLVHCCANHIYELDSDCAAFERKYAERIEQLAAEYGRGV